MVSVDRLLPFLPRRKPENRTVDTVYCFWYRYPVLIEYCSTYSCEFLGMNDAGWFVFDRCFGHKLLNGRYARVFILLSPSPASPSSPIKAIDWIPMKIWPAFECSSVKHAHTHISIWKKMQSAVESSRQFGLCWRTHTNLSHPMVPLTHPSSPSTFSACWESSCETDVGLLAMTVHIILHLCTRYFVQCTRFLHALTFHSIVVWLTICVTGKRQAL